MPKKPRPQPLPKPIQKSAHRQPPIPLIASFEIGEPPPRPEYLCGPFDNIILRAFKEGTTWDDIEPRLRALYEEAIRLQHPPPAPLRGRPSKLVPPKSGIEFYFRLIDDGLAQGEAEGEITRMPGQVPMYTKKGIPVLQDYLVGWIRQGVRLPGRGQRHPESTYQKYARLYELVCWKALLTPLSAKDRVWLDKHFRPARWFIEDYWRHRDNHQMPSDFVRRMFLHRDAQSRHPDIATRRLSITLPPK